MFLSWGIAVFASDCVREIGTVVFIRQNGEFFWDRKIFQFVNGLAQAVE